ncbi:hypothetical protein EN943_06625 [Mesorhizobium sp. M7A.F.Ca.US.006.01.1.1]|uniref:hypothetical protein n=1 Tax=Mesorhizobium sp. M7A.F.Ca.US.006.01.1.1 TaxID=2496707 RepID=UPI000FCBAD83|nr:hypothetical protein [Mesorhizobium sp. M7A.F.Ca.US.006.01.1.1]RUZ79657.1 hypothetical protein EN943_06625 [Mesorhizobium sp. M7A.F.Ca.US.006.01.1.1]
MGGLKHHSWRSESRFFSALRQKRCAKAGLETGTTNSTTSTVGDMNSNADQNCPTNPQRAQTDANGNATAASDNTCGK